MDDLLDLGAVVGEDGGGGDGRGDAGVRDGILYEGAEFGGEVGWQGGGAGLEGSEGGGLARGDDQGVAEGVGGTRLVDDENAGKDLAQGRDQGVYEGVVGGGAPDVDGYYAVVAQVVVYELEELDGRELKGDVGRAVGVDSDHVVGRACPLLR